MIISDHGDGTKDGSSVVKMGGIENVVVTFTVMSPFPFIES